MHAIYTKIERLPVIPYTPVMQLAQKSFSPILFLHIQLLELFRDIVIVVMFYTKNLKMNLFILKHQKRTFLDKIFLFTDMQRYKRRCLLIRWSNTLELWLGVRLRVGLGGGLGLDSPTHPSEMVL